MTVKRSIHRWYSSSSAPSVSINHSEQTIRTSVKAVSHLATYVAFKDACISGAVKGLRVFLPDNAGSSDDGRANTTQPSDTSNTARLAAREVVATVPSTAPVTYSKAQQMSGYE